MFNEQKTHLLITDLAFTLLHSPDDLDKGLLDRLLQRARNPVGTFELLALELLAFGGSHCS
jgi:hypothetical protein